MVCKVDIVQTVLEHVLLLKKHYINVSNIWFYEFRNMNYSETMKQLKTRYVFFLIFCQYLNFSVTIKARSAFK